MKEIEIRAHLKDSELINIKNLLTDFGFEKKNSYIQTDTMMDLPDGSLFKSGRKIRIREEKGEIELSYKGFFEGDVTKSRRVEINIPLKVKTTTDAVSFFEALGYPFLFRIVKTREIFEFNNMVATLDHWPIIGYVLEIEGSEEDLNTVLSYFQGKVNFSNRLLKDMLKSVVEETGKSIQVLKEEYESETGNEIGKIELIMD